MQPHSPLKIACNETTMKNSILILLLGVGSFATAQNSGQMLSVAYEGGTITHPGLSVGYSKEIKNVKQWHLILGAKAGFYYHKRYHTAVFLLPNLQLNHIGSKGFLIGADLHVGPQRTFIPNVYEVDDAGNVSRNKSAGILQWVVAPGIRFGKDLSIKKGIPLQWFINPQLQFRNPMVGRNEIYFLLSIGINYKLK